MNAAVEQEECVLEADRDIMNEESLVEQLEKEYNECRNIEDELHAAAKLTSRRPNAEEFAYRRDNQH